MLVHMATYQQMTGPQAYNRSIRELGIPQLETQKRDVQNELSDSVFDRQVAPLSAIQRTRWTSFGADVTLLFIYR
jgi:hypothetical protein